MKEAAIGTAAFVLEDSQQLFKIVGAIQAPGPKSYMNAYRAELAGMLATITYINNICTLFGINSGCIKLGCDSLGAIDNISQGRVGDPVKTKEKHYDISTSIMLSLQQSTIDWSFEHVKGHQDDEIPYKKPSRLAQLNVQADKWAKRRLSAILAQDTLSSEDSLPLEPCSISW